MENDDVNDIVSELNGELTAEIPGKDPQTGRFVKGNQLSRGRRDGSLSFKTQYRRAIAHLAKLNNVTEADLEIEMYANAIKRARAGDFAFYRDTMDRVHGRAIQPTDITTGGNPFFTVSKEIAEKNGIGLTEPEALPPPQDDPDTETE